MIPAQPPVGLFAPLVPVFLLVGVFTLWVWGRSVAGTSGKPVAMMAVAFSSIVALGVFIWQQTIGAPQVLSGPDLLLVPGQLLQSPAVIDVSFYVDGLSLFWLALVSGLGALTILLDASTVGRGGYLWFLLALACAQLVVLTNNLVVLLGVWEFGQIAVWRWTLLNGTGDETARPPLLALAGDLPLLLAVVVCWQNFGGFHLSLLTAPETLAAVGPNQRAALVLLVYCVLAAAWARCLQFPFCTPVLDAHATASVDEVTKSNPTLALFDVSLSNAGQDHTSPKRKRGNKLGCESNPSIALRAGVDSGGRSDSIRVLVTLIVPPGLYLLLRFQALIAAEPGLQTPLVGVGAFSALLWGGMAVTQPTLARSVVSYFAGTVGLVFAGVGGGEFGTVLLLAGSVTAGSWAILQLVDVVQEKPARLATRGAAVIAVVMCCGVFGQEAALNSAWSTLAPLERSMEPGAGLLESTGGSPEQPPIRLAAPVVMMLTQLLLSLALFRGLFRRRLADQGAVNDESPGAEGPVPDDVSLGETFYSSLAIPAVLIVGLATAPVLLLIMLRREGGIPFSAPGMMGLLMFVGLLLAYVLYAGPSPWPARIERAVGGLATLCRRSLYVDDVIQWMWVMPWTFLGWLAASGDRSFLSNLDRRLRDAQAGVRQSVQATVSEGALAVYLITLIMGAAVMIALLARG